MFYTHEVNEWAWPRVHVYVTTFTQFAQTASLLALNVSMHYNFVYGLISGQFFFLLSEAINVALLSHLCRDQAVHVSA